MEMLLEQFKTVFDRPEKVKQLRELILQLAVQGKLVTQDPSDEPASDLLQKIQAEKEQLIAEKKIKKEKSLPPITEEEVPFELPKGWEWVRMRFCAENIHYGYTASATRNETGTRFVRITDIQNNQVQWGNVPFCEIEDNKLDTYKLRNNDILIARTGGTIGKSFLVSNIEHQAVFASYLIRVIPLNSTYAKYMKLFLDTPLYWTQLISKAQGTGQPNVNAVSLSELVMPLPPIQEQHRIVERVDQLMTLCDQLESYLEQKLKYRELSSKSVFSSISNCSTSEEVEVQLQFILSNFKDLTLSDNGVKELRNSILQLAVQGKLVPQDTTDEPASVLLEHIQKEKEQLIADKKIKREKELPPISEEEIPFELPNGWEWVRLGEVINLTSGRDVSPQLCNDKGIGAPYILGASNIQCGRFIVERWIENPVVLCNKGDLLLSCKGTVGKTLIINEPINLSRQIMSLRDIKDLDIHYLKLFIDQYVTHLNEISKGLIPGISREDVLYAYFPIPPINEQHRIVQKVDTLMALCDQLQEQINKSKVKNELLLKSILQKYMN